MIREIHITVPSLDIEPWPGGTMAVAYGGWLEAYSNLVAEADCNRLVLIVPLWSLTDWDALCRAAPRFRSAYFDGGCPAPSVLSAFTELEWLCLDAPGPEATDLTVLPNLSRLQLWTTAKHTGAFTHPGVRSLQLKRCALKEPLSIDSPVESLAILGCRGVAFGDKAMPSLKALEINSIRSDVSLPSAELVPALTELHLEATRRCTNLAEIARYRGLQKLVLRSVGRLPDLEFLRGSVGLTQLEVSGNTIVGPLDRSLLDSLESLRPEDTFIVGHRRTLSRSAPLRSQPI